MNNRREIVFSLYNSIPRSGFSIFHSFSISQSIDFNSTVNNFLDFSRNTLNTNSFRLSLRARELLPLPLSPDGINLSYEKINNYKCIAIIYLRIYLSIAYANLIDKGDIL